MRVEFLFFDDCPHAVPARALLTRCMATLGIAAAVEEHEGDYASPTILLDGGDVMDAPAVTGRCCRLDIPTEERVLAALRHHLAGGS